METALPNFSVRHLSIWTELIQPVSLQDAVTSVDVEETEEVTAEAQFREVRSKIRSLCRNRALSCSSTQKDLRVFRTDELSWITFKTQQQKRDARAHIMKVSHARAQLAIGKGSLCGRGLKDRGLIGNWRSTAVFGCPRIVEKFMSKTCSVNLLGDVATMPMVDPWIRQAAVDCKARVMPCRQDPKDALQVKLDQLQIVVIIDFTKLGTLTTVDLNKHFNLLTKILGRNQQCCLET